MYRRAKKRKEESGKSDQSGSSALSARDRENLNNLDRHVQELSGEREREREDAGRPPIPDQNNSTNPALGRQQQTRGTAT